MKRREVSVESNEDERANEEDEKEGGEVKRNGTRLTS